MLSFKKTDSKEPCMSEAELIFNSLKNARYELKQAASTFNELTDSAAVDYAAYNLLAAKAKYSYLLKLAKSKNIKI